ncbi:MAG: hypothetical protein ACXACA_06565 [Candidatus Ranarchaeia archaeon]
MEFPFTSESPLPYKNLIRSMTNRPNPEQIIGEKACPKLKPLSVVVVEELSNPQKLLSISNVPVVEISISGVVKYAAREVIPISAVLVVLKDHKLRIFSQGFFLLGTK